MNHTSKLSLACHLLPALALAFLPACSARDLSLGANAVESAPLTPDLVSPARLPCPDGFAHPNICCDSSSFSCKQWTSDPFHPCEKGFATFPNGASCCSLSDPSQCSAPIQVANHVSCLSACAPGWSEQNNGPPGTCCASVNGALSCYLALGTAAVFSPSAGSPPPNCPPGTLPLTSDPNSVCCSPSPAGLPTCFQFVSPAQNLCPPYFLPNPATSGSCCQSKPEGGTQCLLLPAPSADCPAGYEPDHKTDQCCRLGNQAHCFQTRTATCSDNLVSDYFGNCCHPKGSAHLCFSTAYHSGPAVCPAGFTEALGPNCCTVLPNGQAICLSDLPTQKHGSSLCQAQCPNGFAPESGQLCCSSKHDAARQCFSQASGWLAPP